MKKILLFIAFIGIGLLVKAQNITVSGVFENDSTWDADTVFVDGDITIPDTVTLTVSPGVVVVFNDFYRILVEGAMISVGTENEIIEYTAADTSGYFNDFSHIGWNGIDFDNPVGSMDDNDSSHFAYCSFAFAQEFDDWDGGAAIMIYAFSKLMIEQCLFQNNYSYGTGGAIGIQSDAEPVISNCQFLGNNAGYGGGAINVGCYDDYAVFDQPVIRNCYFSGNKSWYEGGSSYGGGAVKLSGSTDALVINNYFENNSSLSQGGAMISSGYANPWVVNNVFTGNTAGHNGGAIGLKYYAGGYFLNNTIIMNTSEHYGGAVSIGCDNDSVFFANNIIGGNQCDSSTFNQFYIDSEDEYMQFYNNDIENGLEDIYTAIVYIENIDEDPEMIDLENGDFLLMCGSPCIDAARDTFTYFPELDMAGMDRLTGLGYDMGAYETQYPEVDLGADRTIAADGSATLDAGAGFVSYLWSTAETSQTITANGSALGVGEHTISVTVTNEYVCEDSDAVVITVQPGEGLDELINAGISVFPNPNSGLFTIVAQNAEITITDINGRIVETSSSIERVTIDLSGEAKGLYLINIVTQDYAGMLKMTIQ